MQPERLNICAPLQAALAELALNDEQLSRIEGKLMQELQQCRKQHPSAACTLEVSLHTMYWLYGQCCSHPESFGSILKCYMSEQAHVAYTSWIATLQIVDVIFTVAAIWWQACIMVTAPCGVESCLRSGTASAQ